MHTIADVQYLDLDGDGVPDAVLTVERWPDDAAPAEAPTVVETLERGIGIDGRPRDVRMLTHR
jgi:hypothetical protein